MAKLNKAALTIKSQLTITQVNTLENQRKKTTETTYKFLMQEFKKEKEKISKEKKDQIIILPT